MLRARLLAEATPLQRGGGGGTREKGRDRTDTGDGRERRGHGHEHEDVTPREPETEEKSVAKKENRGVKEASTRAP